MNDFEKSGMSESDFVESVADELEDPVRCEMYKKEILRLAKDGYDKPKISSRVGVAARLMTDLN